MIDLNAVLEGIDPLNKFSIAEMDPLSQMATNMVTPIVLKILSSLLIFVGDLFP